MHPQVKHSVKHCYEFGPFRVDADERLLYRDGEVVPLTAKVFDILLVFITNSRHTLTKEELMEQVWPGNFVEEGNLTRNVSTLRKALGESPDEHRYIVTIPGRGYRFVAEVREVTDEAERPIIPSNVAELAGDRVDEPVGAEAPAFDRTAVSDGEGVVTVERTVKRPSPLSSRRQSIVLALAALVVLLAAVGGLVAWYFRPKPVPPEWRAVPLTSDPGYERNPALSPDGNQVAFAWNGEKQDNFDIYLKLIDSGQPLRLTTNPAEDVSPAWSPDGRQIAFLRRLGDGRNDLLLIPALAGPERKLAETLIVDSAAKPRLHLLAWSPDERWLAVSHRESEDLAEGLFLVSAQTGEKRRLTHPPQGVQGDFAPAFSPDGRALVFSRLPGDGSGRAVCLLSLSGDYKPAGEVRRLKTGELAARSPVWTRDGRHVLYISAAGQGEQTELRRIAVSGSGSSERVTLMEGNISELSFGRHLVYTENAADNNIWRAEIPAPGVLPVEPRLLISSTRWDGMPRYSPDGKKIAFGSTRSGAQEIWIADADGSNPVKLTSFGGPQVGFLSWSPDGQRLAFHARPEGQADLFTIPAAGGAPKRLNTDPSDDLAPSYSHDGRWLYFVSLRSGQAEVWKMPAEGGAATRITSGGGGMPLESPDGQTLYYAHPSQEKGIWKIPVQGGEAAQVTGPIGSIVYAIAADGIFYRAAPDSRRQNSIQFLSFSTGQSQTVVVSDRPIGALSLSPDRRFLVFARQDRTGSDLMLIENFVVR